MQSGDKPKHFDAMADVALPDTKSAFYYNNFSRIKCKTAVGCIARALKLCTRCITQQGNAMIVQRLMLYAVWTRRQVP